MALLLANMSEVCFGVGARQVVESRDCRDCQRGFAEAKERLEWDEKK
jgi:hypothetical protein